MRKIFWDTNLFIYLIEQNPEFYDKVVKLRKEMIEKEDKLISSTLTLGEILVKPIQQNRHDLVELYRNILKSPKIVLVQFDEIVAENYSKIRATYLKKVRPPDAIQLSCASSYGVDIFITNDDRLKNVNINGIQEIIEVNDL